MIDPKIVEHRGRIVKTTGDGLLVEFASVVDAAESAIAIQRAMAEREADIPEDRRIQYRVGINLGDIVIDGDDSLACQQGAAHDLGMGCRRRPRWALRLIPRSRATCAQHARPLWLPKIPSGMIPRDSGGHDMILIDDRNYQNAVVDSRLADQIA